MIYVIARDPHRKRVVVRSPTFYTAKEFLLYEAELRPGKSKGMFINPYPNLEMIDDQLVRYAGTCGIWGWPYWIRTLWEGLSQDLSRDGIQDLEE